MNRNERLQAEAAGLAPALIGLTSAQAQAVVDEHADLTVRFAEAGQPVRAIFYYGRINAWLRDDVVVRTDRG